MTFDLELKGWHRMYQAGKERISHLLAYSQCVHTYQMSGVAFRGFFLEDSFSVMTVLC